MIHPTETLIGYLPGARALGYLPGARALGDISAAMMVNGQLGGIATEDLVLLSQLGATDNDIMDLLNRTTTLPALYAQYGATVTSPPSGILTPAPSSQGQIPTGSTLIYQATSSRGLLSKLFTSTASIVAQFNSHLSGTGLSVLNYQPSGAGTIQIHIADNVGHQYISDAQGVLDDAMRAVISGELAGSHVTVVSQPTGNAGLPKPPATSFTQWLQDNALYIGIGLGAIFLGPGLIKKL